MLIHFLGLILALLPTYLWRFNLFSIPTTFLELLIVVFLLAVIIETVARRFIGAWRADLPAGRQVNQHATRIKNLGRINWAIAAFVIAGIISTVVSPDLMKALGQLKAFIIEPVLFFYAVVLTVNSQQSKVIILRYLFISASLISLFGLIQYVTHFQLPLQFWGSGDEPKRITSFFEYPNALALYLAPVLAFFITLKSKRFDLVSTPWFITGLVVMSLALVLTFSRGAWLAIILGCLLPMLLAIGWRKRLVIIIAVLAVGLLPAVQNRLTIQDKSTEAHGQLLDAAVTKLASSPILGNGLYGFRSTLEQQNFQGEILNYPHNIILNFWLELGVLGLISFIAVMFLVFTKFKKRPGVLTLAAGVYLLVMLLHGLVDVPYFKNDLSVLFWFMISLFYVNSDTNITNSHSNDTNSLTL